MKIHFAPEFSALLLAVSTSVIYSVYTLSSAAPAPRRKVMCCVYKFAFLFFIFFSFLAHAETQDLYTFHSPQKEAEFNNLLKDLRCLVCQNQDLHDSQTPFAEGLRQQIHQWVLEGKSQKDIMTILTNQYGDSIAFQPPLKSNTALLWIAPFVLFALCIIFLIVFIRKKETP